MSRRTLDVVDLVELFVHWEAGRSQVPIGESLGLDRKTVRKYLAPAVAAGLETGGAAAGVGGASRGVVPAGRGRPVAAGDVAGDRGAPRLHRGAVAGGGDGRDDQCAAGRGAGVVGVAVLVAAVDRGEPVRADAAGTGERPEAAGGAGQRGADRLRQAQGCGPIR